MKARIAALLVVLAASAAVIVGPDAGARNLIASHRARSTSHSSARGPQITRQQFARAAAAGARDAAARRRWLATPAVRAQRLASRTAYRHLSAGRARQVVLGNFGAFLKNVGTSPATSVAAAGRVLRYLNNETAIVQTQAGKRLLERSTTPLRSDGGPIDLTLHSYGGAFSPIRSAQRVSIADSLAGGATVGSGIDFALEGANVKGALAGQNTVLYPNAARDLDASATPTAAGLDLSVVMRSPASPQTVHYRVTLPAGYSLRPAGTHGATVNRDSTPILSILPPISHDAQGTPVPVALRVSGDQLTLRTDRPADVAYPVLVDPQITVSPISAGWQFTNGYCTVDPPPGPFVAPRAGEIDGPAGSYIYLQCPEWVWTSASAGLGKMTRVELDDVDYSADPAGNMQQSIELLELDGDYSTYSCSDTATPAQPDLTDSWSGNEVWTGTECGDAVRLMIEVIRGGNEGPVSLSVGSVLVTAPYLPAPEAPELFGGGNPGEPDFIQKCAGSPVDCASGNMFESDTDLAVHGRGLPLAVTRTYNAQGAVTQTTPGLFGYGWSTSFSDHLLIDTTPGTVTVVQANGSEVPYNGTTGTLSPEGGWVEATLVHNSDGTYTYTLPDQETEQFDTNGRLTSESDRYGNTLTCAYDGSGNLASVTDGADRRITFAHNPDGTISQATGPMGSVSYGYDASGDLTQVTDLNGGTWAYGYDASHRMTSETDARGNTITTRYDSANRVMYQTDGADRTRHWSYGTDATTITNPGGDVTYEEFNQAGEPVSVTRGYGTSSATTQTMAYNAAYELTAVNDGNGHQSTYTYDAAGNRTSATDPLGNETQWSYNTDHDVTSIIDPLDHTTTYGYTTGELTSISRPLTETGQTQTTQYAYDAHGDLTGITDPRNKQTTYGYDIAGDLTSITSPSSAQTSWTYDGSGYPTAMTSAAGNTPGAIPAQYTTTYQNNPFGQPTEITDPDGNVTKLSYDPDGNLASQTDAAGNRTTYSYDGDNEPTGVRRPDGTTQTTSYTDDGQISSQTNGASDTTTYGYDPVGDQTSSTDALHRETDYSYDAAGNLATLTDPAGRITTYGYDTANELTSINYSDGTTPNVGYVYNADGQRTSMSDGTGTTTYSYDSLSRLTDLTDGASQQIAYGYDLDNNITSITYPNSQSITQTYDDSERLASITDWLGNTTSFGYDTDSNLQTTTYPTATNDVDSYTYDHADQLTSITMAQATTTLASMTYQPAPTGQLASTTENGLPEPATPTSNTYAYDSADRATQLDSHAGYNYDAAGELTSSPVGGYSYDQLGDRTQLVPTTGTSTHYGYDQAGRLISYTPPSGSPTAYAYNGDGLRASKTTGTNTTAFAWDQSGPLPLLLSDGTNNYVYGPDELPIEQISSSGQVEYLHHGRLGSTRLVTDASGNVAGAYTYSPYGALTAHTGTATTPLQYAGQYTDSESGLQYDRDRYYDATTGQFLTPDPLQALTGDPYGYANNDPIDQSDPTGALGLVAACAVGEEIAPEGGCAAGAAVSGVLALASVILGTIVNNQSNNANSAAAGAADEAAPGQPDAADVNSATGADCSPTQTSATEGGTRIPDATSDATRKVHGQLPSPADLGEYDPEALATLRDELEQSVQTRIEKTVELGADYGHSARIAEEQALIRSIDKYLADH